MYIKNEIYRRELESVWREIPGAQKLCHKSILITGGTGLIGSFLADLLLYANKEKDAGIQIYLLARNEKRIKERFASSLEEERLHFVIQDVVTPFALSVPIDYIIHAAGDGFPSAFREHPVETMTPALFGTYHLLQYARECQAKRFLYISSGEVYGRMPGNKTAFTEDDCGYLNTIEVRSCYPIAKRCGETLCVSFGEEYQIPVVVARLSHIYGACVSNSDNRATAQFLDCVCRGESIVLNSAGRQMRSYTYVADCVSGILTVLLNGTDKEAYNIANPISRVTIAQFARILADVAGSKCIMKIPDEKGKKEQSPIEYAVLDSSKLENLGWQGQYDIYKGIEHMFDIRKMVRL